ncbi:malectin domain-containing carbohydrate-binding protein [Verrucomicrobiales bacterium]|nr:malectin domain-containing carbohydrate-binding protein [Verrucomicrobiales bacterium]
MAQRSIQLGKSTSSGATKDLRRADLDVPDAYRTARYIPEESSGFYVIPVPAGRYLLQLHFIEGHVKNADERISNILKDYKLFFEKVDILPEAEFHQPLVKETTVDGAAGEPCRLIFAGHVENLRIAENRAGSTAVASLIGENRLE